MLVLIQLSVNSPQRKPMIIQLHESLTCAQEIWVEFLVSGFSLAYFDLQLDDLEFKRLVALLAW